MNVDANHVLNLILYRLNYIIEPKYMLSIKIIELIVCFTKVTRIVFPLMRLTIYILITSLVDQNYILANKFIISLIKMYREDMDFFKNDV